MEETVCFVVTMDFCSVERKGRKCNRVQRVKNSISGCELGDFVGKFKREAKVMCRGVKGHQMGYFALTGDKRGSDGL